MMLDRLPSRTWWTSVAAILTFLFLGGMFTEIIIDKSKLSFIQYTERTFNCIGVLPLWGLGLQRKLLNERFWRLFFLVDAVLFVVAQITIDDPATHKYPLALILSLIVLIFTPNFIGIYLYAFRSDKLWGRMVSK